MNSDFVSKITSNEACADSLDSSAVTVDETRVEVLTQLAPNKALQLTVNLLRGLSAAELGR